MAWRLIFTYLEVYLTRIRIIYNMEVNLITVLNLLRTPSLLQNHANSSKIRVYNTGRQSHPVRE